MAAAKSDRPDSFGRVASIQPKKSSATCRLRSCWTWRRSPRRPSADRLLDRIDSGDPLQRFLDDGTLPGGIYIVELGPDVRPAGHRDHRPWLPLGGVERVEPGIGIGDEVAGKAGQVALRVVAPVVEVLEVGRRQRYVAAVRALVAHVDPQPSGFGPAHARRQHRHRRVVGVRPRRGHHLLAQQGDQRLQDRRGALDLVGQHGTFQRDPLTNIDFRLAAERLAPQKSPAIGLSGKGMVGASTNGGKFSQHAKKAG